MDLKGAVRARRRARDEEAEVCALSANNKFVPVGANETRMPAAR